MDLEAFAEDAAKRSNCHSPKVLLLIAEVKAQRLRADEAEAHLSSVKGALEELVAEIATKPAAPPSAPADGTKP